MSPGEDRDGVTVWYLEGLESTNGSLHHDIGPSR